VEVFDPPPAQALVPGVPVQVEFAGKEAAERASFYFVPQASGWYIFETYGSTNGEAYTLMPIYENGNDYPLYGYDFLLLNSKDWHIGSRSVSSKEASRVITLKAGTEYWITVNSAIVEMQGDWPDWDTAVPAENTFQLRVIRAEDEAGRGSVQPKDVKIGAFRLLNNALLGDRVRAYQLFPEQLPPYRVLRVEVLGDSVDEYLSAVKAGQSTLVFYDMAGNEVGRSTVTVSWFSWWQTLLTYLRFVLSLGMM